MTQRLNLKWSVADVDQIVAMIRAQWTMEEICKRFGRGLTTDDVKRMHWESKSGIYAYRRTQEAGRVTLIEAMAHAMAEATGASRQVTYQEMAVAALKAMRDPTEAMAHAGMAASPLWLCAVSSSGEEQVAIPERLHVRRRLGVSGAEFAVMFTAAIDAAIAEEQT